ncbi:MAG: hypothetical protein ACK47V_04740, partial [Betaproteobacteria bacterium]
MVKCLQFSRQLAWARLCTSGAAFAGRLFAAALALFLGAQASLAWANTAVGSVSLLVGQAHAIGADGNARKLERGAA